MIDNIRDNIYNIILSIFLGVFLILSINFIHELPITVTLDSNRFESFDNDSKCF